MKSVNTLANLLKLYSADKHRLEGTALPLLQCEHRVMIAAIC